RSFIAFLRRSERRRNFYGQQCLCCLRFTQPAQADCCRHADTFVAVMESFYKWCGRHLLSKWLPVCKCAKCKLPYILVSREINKIINGFFTGNLCVCKNGSDPLVE